MASPPPFVSKNGVSSTRQVSLRGFSLAAWFEAHGADAYLKTLECIAKLVRADKLRLSTTSLDADGLTTASLKAAVHTPPP